MSLLSDLDTAVQEVRVETHASAFKDRLAQIVTALGTIQDLPPATVTADDMKRLRELVEETVEAIERRIDTGGDSESVQQHLAGTVYEVRRRMEAVEVWFKHFH
jgi:hypothetical protein